MLLLSYANEADSMELKNIVIDPGHGGSDKGGEGRDGVLEKDMALQISMSLKKKIMDKMKLNAVMTRDKDYDVPLGKRVAIANASNGGLFISIHTGSAHSDELSGIGIYYPDYEGVGNESGEIDVDDMEDEKKDVEVILKDMALSDYVNEGTILSELLQKNLTDIIPDQKIILKPAPISILKDVNMPSVLIEVGNITNSEDVKRLKDREYIDKIADAILNSIKDYNNAGEKENLK
jgi:N-acetylmuramoyl-L-alanine amidase